MAAHNIDWTFQCGLLQILKNENSCELQLDIF